MKKTTAKDRKTYPAYVFITTNADKTIDSTWTTETELSNIFELARINANHEEGATCTVWQKTKSYNNLGSPVYARAFYLNTEESAFYPKVTPSERIDGFIKGQRYEFDSSKWQENRLNPIRMAEYCK